MPFPSPSLTPPTLANYQLWFGGLAFGGVNRLSAYSLQSLPTGLDVPAYISGDSQRPIDQGEFAGIDLSPGRDITVTQTMIGATQAALEAARQQLSGVLAPAGAIEAPLYIQLASGLFACMARPRKHNFTLDNNMVQVLGGVATTLFHATDPRWYAIPTKTQTVGLPTPAGGLLFPVTFNASFGGGGTGGILQIHNNGTIEMRPVLVIAGPCTNPVITNLSLNGTPSIGVTITLNTGDTLVIDTDLQSIVYTAAGTSAGVSRQNAQMPGNVWWNCPPGLSQIEFTTSDGVAVAGTLTVQSADAYIGL